MRRICGIILAGWVALGCAACKKTLSAEASEIRGWTNAYSRLQRQKYCADGSFAHVLPGNSVIGNAAQRAAADLYDIDESVSARSWRLEMNARSTKARFRRVLAESSGRLEMWLGEKRVDFTGALHGALSEPCPSP